MGNPKGKYNEKYSLEPVGRVLSETLDAEIFFPDNSIGEAVKKIVTDMQPGHIMLLENLEFQKGEMKWRGAGVMQVNQLKHILDQFINEKSAG